MLEQHHLKPALLQHLVGRNPVDAGGLHGDGLDPAPGKPVRQAVQVVREGLEGLDRVGVAVWADGCQLRDRFASGMALDPSA